VNKKVLVVGLLLTMPLVVLFALSFGRDPHRLRSPLVGREAPPFTLKRVGDGLRMSLSELRGKPVILNFWATWCEPCKLEHGVLRDASAQLGERVRFVGMVYEDEEPRILDFLTRHGSGYSTLIDEGGKVAIAYGVYGVPETFFIDSTGKIIDKYEGPLSPAALYGFAQKLLVGR
jgi:cytochrome c biogenesis protein CcmG/thiol:disulfide interchange protein DsbE